jgi:hypothetical protein
VKYADDRVLLANEETVLQGVIDSLIETGKFYGLEMNVGKKNKVIRISRQYRLCMTGQKPAGECSVFQLTG